MKIQHEQIVEQLKNNICEVSFTKVNGEPRVMLCTLREDLLPAKTDTTKEKKVNENVVSVWATDANGWRSFRADSVTNIEVLASV